MTVISIPYHLDEYLPDLDWPLEPDATVTVTFPDGDPWERLAALSAEVARAVAAEASRAATAGPGAAGPGRGHLVLLTGDCLASLGMVTGLQQAGAEPAVIWFDAHGDVQTPETTASGYLGGMPLRLLTGYRPELIAARLGLRPVPEDRIVLVGARDLDPPEVAYLDAAPIRRRRVADLTSADLPAGPLYVHVDLDVVDAAVLPGLRYAVPGGPDAAQLGDALGLVLATGQVAALAIACTWYPGHAAAQRVAPYLRAVLALCRTAPAEHQPGVTPRRSMPTGALPRLLPHQPALSHAALVPRLVMPRTCRRRSCRVGIAPSHAARDVR